MRDSSSRPSHFPKALLPNSITLGLGFQQTNLGGLGAKANIQSQHWSGAHMPFDISFLSLPIIYVLTFLPLVPFLASLITPDPVTDDINFFSICIHYALPSLSYSLLTLSQSAADLHLDASTEEYNQANGVTTNEGHVFPDHLVSLSILHLTWVLPDRENRSNRFSIPHLQTRWHSLSF